MADILSMVNGVIGMGERGRQMGQQSRLASLMGQAYQAPRDQRGGYIAQMMATDPNAGLAANKAFDGMDDSARENLGRYASVFSSLPDEQKPMAYAELASQAKALGLPVPDEYKPEYAPHIAKIAQAFGGGALGASGVQSTYVDAAGNRVAIMRDGSTRVLGQNDAGMSQQTIEVQGPDGRPLRYTFDKRTGNYVPMGAGQATAAQPRAAGEVPFAIDPSLPPDIQASIRSDESRWATMPEINIGPAGGMPVGIGQSPAEKAYAEQIAKTQAELDAGGAVTRLEADRAAAKARAEAAAKAQAEVDAKAATRTRDADQTLALLDEAERILPQATGSRAGSVRDSLAGMAGIATEGAKASDSLKIIAAELVAKVPRFEGPQSNIDVQFYREAAGDLANDQLPVERRMAALQTIRRLRQKYASQQPAKRSYTQQEALQKLQEARRAIGNGADREAVRQRLRDLGLNNIAERL